MSIYKVKRTTPVVENSNNNKIHNIVINYIRYRQQQFNYDNTIVEVAKQLIKHYRLKEEYREKSIALKIEVYWNNTKIGYISSETTININGKDIDIGEYIDSNNITDPDEIETLVKYFTEIYEEA